MDFADSNDVDIVECGYVTFNCVGDLETVRHEDRLSDKANGLLYGFPWGKIFKSELFSRVCFPENYWFEDTVMAFVVFPMCKRVATSSVLLYHYRINPSGITHTSRGKPKALDTFYVTRQLLKDRSVLGLNNDMAFYDTMLRQVRMNYNRVKKLGSGEVDRAVFALTADLWRNYFLEFDGQIQSPLAKALCENNFKAYKLILEFT